jgi:hypothetical protein
VTSSNTTAGKNEAQDHPWQILIEFTLPGRPGYEHLAVAQITEAVQPLNWPEAHLAQLKREVSKAVFRAIERSPPEGSESWLWLRVLLPKEVWARQGADPANHAPSHRLPPPGWGFFLVQKQEDKSSTLAGEAGYLIELFLYQEREQSRKYKPNHLT